MMDMPFDTIMFDTDRGRTTLTLDDFAKIPLVDRVAALLKNRLHFLRGGQPVDPRLALAALRRRAA